MSATVAVSILIGHAQWTIKRSSKAIPAKPEVNDDPLQL